MIDDAVTAPFGDAASCSNRSSRRPAHIERVTAATLFPEKTRLATLVSPSAKPSPPSASPIGDEQDFDNAAGRAEINKLVADGYLDPADVPKDEPDVNGPVERFSAERDFRDIVPENKKAAWSPNNFGSM